MRDQRTVLKRQAGHLEEQAVQLKASVTQTKDTAERQLRAYLCRTGRPQCNELIQQDQRKIYEFLVPIRNAGQTPAYRVVARGRAAFYPVPLPGSADLGLDPAPETASRSPLGPGRELDVVCTSEPLDLNQLQWMQTHYSYTLYLRGLVTYEDAFGHPRTLEFCEGVDWRRWPVAVTTYATDRHNEAD